MENKDCVLLDSFEMKEKRNEKETKWKFGTKTGLPFDSETRKEKKKNKKQSVKCELKPKTAHTIGIACMFFNPNAWP